MTLAVLLAVLHGILALSGSLDKSMTADEIAYLTAGQAYNTRGDYRLQPENGNLPQRWAALPETVMGAPLPPTNSIDWQHADVWTYGHTFFYGENAPISRRWLIAGRGMITLFSVATALLVFIWSRALCGWRGAFVSLLLFALSPSFLAHGALATSDVMMTFFLLACVGAWWRHLHNPGWVGAALSATLFGLACVTKVSAVLLVPMFGLIALGWGLGSTHPARATLWRLARSTALHGAAAWAIIWLFYGFRFSAFAPGLAAGAGFYRGDWNWILDDLGWKRPVLVALRDWHVLPEAFLYGFTFVLQFAKARSALLNGAYSTTGWVGFFPYAFLVKTTLPCLLLLLAGLISGARAAGRHPREQLRAWLARLQPWIPLAALFFVYALTSLASHLNIGHRHILPLYPVLFIAAGRLGTWLDARRPLHTLVISGLLVWHIGASWSIRPHYLAYFNAFAGGPENGYRHLVDSSLDWGQDLPGLQAWLDTHEKGERVYLSYFGSGEPAYYGIRAQHLPCLIGLKTPQPWVQLYPGVYCISATMLEHVYSPIRGSWTPALEEEYQQLRTLEPAFNVYFSDPAQRAEMDRAAPPEKWQHAVTRHALLRFARLCYYLRAREPDTNIGYSILIYRLSAAELAAATTGSLADWQNLIAHPIQPGRP
ncbi:MAG: hypothetical protein ABI420_16200 [Opitutaceae bacterium]